MNFMQYANILLPTPLTGGAIKKIRRGVSDQNIRRGVQLNAPTNERLTTNAPTTQGITICDTLEMKFFSKILCQKSGSEYDQ